jgi:glycosyltransferase 2 family protein
LGGLLVLDACCVVFNHAILNGLVSLVNRVFKKQFGYFEVSKRLLLELHAIHMLAALTYGVSASLCCLAIGYDLTFGHALLVVAASLLSEVGGFLAIVVPGGIGVREGLMYALLGGAATGSLALVLPVASRLVNMAVDVVLGLVAVRLLRSLAVQKNLDLVQKNEPNATP